MKDFLSEGKYRPLLQEGLPASVTAVGLWLGQGDLAFEVALFSSEQQPTKSTIRDIWEQRRRKRATPVLAVVLYGQEKTQAAICWRRQEDPEVFLDLSQERVRSLCKEAIKQKDRHAARKYLDDAMDGIDEKLVGIKTQGLVAKYTLEKEYYPDLKRLAERARATVDQSGEALLEALGYEVLPLDNHTRLLRVAERKTALAILVGEHQDLQRETPGSFNSLPPLNYAFDKADNENLEWVLVTRGTRVRLYSTKSGIGVGRNSRNDTWLECDPARMTDSGLACMWLLLSADALAREGSLSQLLEKSRRYATGLADKLRERIYDEVVPKLAKAINKARNLNKPGKDELNLSYQMAIQVLFRLLFVAYAEARDLLPYKQNKGYRENSLTRLARELADEENRTAEPGIGSQRWNSCKSIWEAIDQGKPNWGIPAYNGGLFATTPKISQIGAALEKIKLPDEDFEYILAKLLLSDLDDRAQPVDFRSLDVREFGTIYEGLLESELSVAETPLKIDTKGVYLPAGPGDKVNVPKKGIYLHNNSGARKSTGSYYTQDIIVEYLLNEALKPALEQHCQQLDKLKQLSEAQAAKAFFDFRVADIAMGSGHFLIAAVDCMEQRLGKWLAENPLPAIHEELKKLEATAQKRLGNAADSYSIEQNSLLRRQIARRCIYGIDLNENAVQLARLALWIHTFVPGLPLSLFDHHLVCGNSLVGLANLDEIEERFKEGKGTLLTHAEPKKLLAMVKDPLKRLTALQDSTPEEIKEGRQIMKKVEQTLQPVKTLCDLITALPLSEKKSKLSNFPFHEWDRHKKKLHEGPEHKEAKELLADSKLFHFPIQFPEIFLGEKTGFDVILGNPPWEETKLDKHEFWARHFPGLRGLKPQSKQEEKIKFLEAERPDLLQQFEQEKKAQARLRRFLSTAHYPGMGTGDADLYKAFCWRFWKLTTAGGHIGVVLPRSVTAAKGSTPFRRHLIEESAEFSLTTLLNKAGWVFKDVEQRYTIALLGIRRGTEKREGTEKGKLKLKGPFADKESFLESASRPGFIFASSAALLWNDEATLPLLPTTESAAIFAQLRKAPRLDTFAGKGWRTRPDRELDATNDKNIMDLTATRRAETHWPILKGESFDLWQPKTNICYGWGDPKVVCERLQKKRKRAMKKATTSHAKAPRSVHEEFSPRYLENLKTLPCHHPRLAFRDITNRTNTRTVISCLLPPRVFLTNKAPYLLWPRGDARDQAFLLGLLCSRALDWYARCFVEINLNYFIFNSLPIPRPTRTDPRWKRVVRLAGRLACPDERFADWAKAVDVRYGPLPEQEKQEMIYELDALACHLYGLDCQQIQRIYETFHRGWDYNSHLQSVLRYWERL